MFFHVRSLSEEPTLHHVRHPKTEDRATLKQKPCGQSQVPPAPAQHHPRDRNRKSAAATYVYLVRLTGTVRGSIGKHRFCSCQSRALYMKAHLACEKHVRMTCKMRCMSHSGWSGTNCQTLQNEVAQSSDSDLAVSQSMSALIPRMTFSKNHGLWLQRLDGGA